MVKCIRIKPGLRVRPALYSKLVREMLFIIFEANRTKRLFHRLGGTVRFSGILHGKNIRNFMPVTGLKSVGVVPATGLKSVGVVCSSPLPALLSELRLVRISACYKLTSTFLEINIMSDILQPLTNIRGSRDAPNSIQFSHKEELLLLALYQKELYGLQIQQAISDSSGGLRQFRIGSLYPMLHSLETKGYVQSRWGEEQHHERGGARRRYYQLTETGSAAVEFIQAFHQNLINWGSGKA
jgi:PadR family transcriptional regulator, regulatory protein PadR